MAAECTNDLGVGRGESPVNGKWVAAYHVITEDDSMNSTSGHSERLPKKVTFELVFEV